MPIRLSGMVSGMDTEALVGALVSSYSLKKDNLTKAQTKLSWKQDSWKAMNTKIYSFYSGKLSSARLSKAYDLKRATIADNTYAKVTASSSAVVGTQTLEVKQLATTGYLTGGIVKGKDEKGDACAVKGDSKLSSIDGLGGLTDASVTVTVGGKSQSIELSGDMTVNQFISKLKSAGLNASFDETNQRFFVSSKTSGAKGDFSLVADNSSGLNALTSMGLFTANATDKAEYAQWAKYADDAEALKAQVDAAYEMSKKDVSARAKEYAEAYNNAKKIVDAMDGDELIARKEGQTTEEALLWGIENLKEKKAIEYEAYAIKDDEGNVTGYDKDKMKDDGKLEEFNALEKKIEANEANLKTYRDNKAVMSDKEKYVTIDDEGNAVEAKADDADVSKYNAVKDEIDKENATIRSNIEGDYTTKAQFAKDMMSTYDAMSSSSGAVRIVGQDSEIVLNGAVFESNSNNFSINGLTIEATAVTAGKQVTVTVGTDVDAIYDSIRSMLKEYNELIKAMDEAYNAASAKGYEPLTSEEKEAMTDDEIEKWEEKIKDSLLRKDSTLGNTATALKNAFASSIEIDGKSYSLANFGIKTQGYFEAAENEKGVYHIDGDSEDSVSSGNTDKLREMIASDPELVTQFFSKLSSNVYNTLSKKMASTSLSSAYTIYNDKQMAKEYSDYTTKISDKEDEIARWEDYYYKKFTAMESAMSKLNSQQSALSGMLGNG